MEQIADRRGVVFEGESDPASVLVSPRIGPPAEVVIGIRDLALHQEVLDFLDRDPRLNVAGAVTDPHRLVSLLRDVEPDVTLLCPTFTDEFRHSPKRGRLVNPVVLTEEMTIPLLRDAIAAGAHGVFAWPEEREQLADALVRFPSIEGGNAPRGRVLVVHGTRGGVGATFVASHLAAACADQGFRTALVDLENGFAGLTLALGVRPDDRPRTVRDLVPVAEELSPDHVEDALYRHHRGFAVLLAPPNDAPLSEVPTGLYTGAIALLAGAYDFVVVHLPRSYETARHGAVAIADDVLLVVALDPYSIYGATRAIEVFRLAETPHRCRIVINRVGRATVRSRDVERFVGVRPSATIRYDTNVRKWQERGQLLRRRAGGAFKDVRALSQGLVQAYGRS
ncbi:MAG TPA: AAA family ATPase [Actinomycetota bacterium]|nr:AAA family ATPase [Actinomycetota bacterium]